ncbi:MAG: wax ester/triacylglycerol synthase family O-acyltransferase [Alteromonadaceae bacterium]|mgnify:CR=1 FL=1|uniref:WS/DGAT/MGAT family O-acyltransferase n=1 Tax=unclassified Marinobacter TaxID=83889 RepID=UPI000C664FF5|nr:wax ester/triacylglycerol synthase family O-acyltransferase [Marinobacter sp. BGYM27]MAA65202.1 wax ester/triacylglycerol synthase family O-acyltransferase [Alteromonadaceae bacterium]MBH86756.1 wax ester/triacylglycerol synthase family O-acyltransferase [Alteromonadaceae bacterium]MDG5500693.1 wax ester/triacylglycerol synthase family O-acyltransferase [Marinobacter sp. BGYM27]|tara:strand:- start:38005 stop:39570 length:1566 start_codon:yes stop_codon:yes gene_type:complete
MRQLSELDASFLYLESDTAPMHIGGIYIFDGEGREAPLPFSTFVSYLRSRLHVVPLFREKLREVPLRLGHPYWIDDADFSIERHLAYVKMGERNDESSLMALASRIMQEPLKRDRPLWHITFVDGLRSPGKKAGDPDDALGFALIVRLHHAAIDAFSGEEIMGKLLEYSPTPDPIKPPQPWHPRPAPSDERALMQVGANFIRKPFRMASVAATAIEATTLGMIQKQMRKLPLPFPLFSAPHSPFNRQITANRKILGSTLPLSRLKAVKASLGDVTLNDVVLGLCAEVLRRYMEEHGADLERPLVAMTPVSVRSKSLRRPTGNQMSAMLLNLATDEPDPARRIRLIHWNAVASEPYQEAIAADRLTEMVPSTMLALSARLYSELQLAQRYQPVFNVPITNVPGPQVPLYLQGTRLARQYNTAPLFDSMGLVIVAVSYEGRLTLNFSICPDVVPDGERLTALLEPCLLDIEKAAATLPAESAPEQSSNNRNPTLVNEALNLAEAMVQKSLRRFRKQERSGGGR